MHSVQLPFDRRENRLRWRCSLDARARQRTKIRFGQREIFPLTIYIVMASLGHMTVKGVSIAVMFLCAGN